MISVKNISGNTLLVSELSVNLLDQESYTIPSIAISLWGSSDEVIQLIVSGDLQVVLDGITLTGISNQIDALKGSLAKNVMSTSEPFASKILINGKRIFRRVRGTSATVNNAAQNIDFVVPYAMCKITGLEILGAILGDTATFQVLDDQYGTISGTPYMVLNTFGENVNLRPDAASYPSKYDADLIGGLILRVVYDCKDQILDPARKVYINYDLHEVKT